MTDVVNVETVVVDEGGDAVEETPAVTVPTCTAKYTGSYLRRSLLGRSGLYGSYLGHGYGGYGFGHGSYLGHGYGGYGGFGHGYGYGSHLAGSRYTPYVPYVPKTTVCPAKVEAKVEEKVEVKTSVNDTVAETLRRSKELVESINA